MASQTRDIVESSMAGGRSYVAGPRDEPLIERTIGEYFAHVAATHGDDLALMSGHQCLRYTYRDLYTEVERVARAFLSVGLGPEDRIAIWSTNCAEWVIAQYSSALIGAILVGINPAYRLRELEFVLNDAGAAMLIAAQGYRESDCRTILRSLAPGLVDDGVRHGRDGLPHLRTVVHLGSPATGAGLTWAELTAKHADVPSDRLRDVRNSVRPSGAATILYTSGTTGAPKGAMLSHRAQLNCGFFVGKRLRYGPSDRLCLPVPFHHAFGSVVGTIGAMTQGSAVVLPSDIFEPLGCLRAVQNEGCTVIYGVPTTFSALVEHPALPDYDVKSLRTGIIAGASSPVGLMQRVIDCMHVPEMTVSFGMTETLATLHTALDDPIERRVSTVGTALPHVECKIVDATGGHIVACGNIGELCTRGYGTMLAYWNDPTTTRAVLDADGWMHTGDLATMHDDGYVSIVGRLKDVINRAGEKVYPGEVEGFLSTHPKIREVYVIGVHDSQYGEELCAWIRLREGEKATAEEIRRYCRGAIARFKIPRYIRFVDEFPSTVTGKVQKFRMREISAAEMIAGQGPR